MYHALTWKVLDLDKVAERLEAQHVRIIARDASMIVVHPKDGIGIPWGFVSATVPGDERYVNEAC